MPVINNLDPNIRVRYTKNKFIFVHFQFLTFSMLQIIEGADDVGGLSLTASGCQIFLCLCTK